MKNATMRERRCAGRTRGMLGVAALSLLLATTAGANGTRGFLLGLGLNTSHVGAADETAESAEGSVFVDETGFGITLTAGYGITPAFALRLAVSGAEHRTNRDDVQVGLGGGVIEAVYLFREGRPVRPYIAGGLGGFTMTSRENSFEYETTGPGATVSIGIFYFVGESFALEFGGRADFINWEKTTARTNVGGTEFAVETPVDEDGTTGKLLFGASYWF